MKTLVMAICLFGLTLISCKKDDVEDQNPTLTTEQVSAAVQVQISGFNRTSESVNWPASYSAIYSNNNNLTVQQGAAASLGGSVISVDDAIVNANFTDPAGVVKRTVNGIDIYGNLDGNIYKAMLFKGQYAFHFTTGVQPEATGKAAVENFATALATNLGNIK